MPEGPRIDSRDREEAGDGEDPDATLKCPHCGTAWPEGPIKKVDRGLVLIGCPSCHVFLTAFEQ